MANSNFIGQSEYSPHKQDNLKKIIKNWILVAKGSSKKPHNGFTLNSFNIIDLTAGNGKTEIDGVTCDGSALIIAKNAFYWATNKSKTQIWDVNYDLYFVEIDPDSYIQLGKELSHVPCSSSFFAQRRIHTTNCDNAVALKALKTTLNPKTLTLYYIDPNGAKLPVKELGEALSISRNHDFLLHYNANALKRVRNHSVANKNGVYTQLTEYVVELFQLRKHIYISKPNTAWQWVFIYGTNTNVFDESLKEMGFLDIDTDEGFERLLFVSFTKNELN